MIGSNFDRYERVSIAVLVAVNSVSDRYVASELGRKWFDCSCVFIANSAYGC